MFQPPREVDVQQQPDEMNDAQTTEPAAANQSHHSPVSSPRDANNSFSYRNRLVQMRRNIMKLTQTPKQRAQAEREAAKRQFSFRTSCRL